ncbi:DUF4670 domain-containing protein [Niabella drilacis]|uniref:Uncharacterized protein n=1 Tax=Niabella drilacis (strain DSM 25811 / CCM 8410 / CCUG 62505 / LMG 26954 / E90) TaxID=1285928 RepID=A0A1G6RZ47_NIADE|nr:hypothetical protein [Niabella drilacis]SDD09930.1 hypothetical protein SAMN04487894_10619 [Niabella drilacis]
MSFKTETCAQCGNLFSYDDSLFGRKPEWGGGMLGGYLCSNCANQRKQEQQLKAFREDDRKRQEMDNIIRENEEDDRYQREQREQRRNQELQRQAEYESANPGEYECPNCLYITLKRNASRCPKCHGTVSSSYWYTINKREAEAQEQARLEADEWERARPQREAAERALKKTKAKRKATIIICSIIGPFLIAGIIAVFSGYSFSRGIEKLVEIITMIIFLPIAIGFLFLIYKIWAFFAGD